MKLWKHVTGQPFVFATGLAALVHSTWSLGTLFAGQEPAQFSPAWFAWLLPALLIAFALDVGQIVTSAEIRSGARTRAKYATFTTFAIATYYLQWLYIAHHMPDLTLAPGVRESWASAATFLRDAAIWFIPALLPLSTLLYTFSHNKPAESEPERNISAHSAGHMPTAVIADLVPVATERAALSSATSVSALLPTPEANAQSGNDTVETFIFTCPDCGFTNTYKTEMQRAQGKRAHSRHCQGRVVPFQPTRNTRRRSSL